MVTLRKAEKRGHANAGWLQVADERNEESMKRNLRVIAAGARDWRRCLLGGIRGESRLDENARAKENRG